MDGTFLETFRVFVLAEIWCSLEQKFVLRMQERLCNSSGQVSWLQIQRSGFDCRATRFSEK
jgi:hypothetical protein